MDYKVGKNPCVKCGSSDAFHFYSEDDGGFCFSCGYKILSKAKKEELGIGKWQYNDEEVMTKEKITKEEIEKIKSYTGTSGKNSRGITDETYKAYACRFKYSEETGEVVETFYPYTEGYEATGFKIRMVPKDFRSLGKIGKDSELFGQWKWKNSTGKYVVITSGEVDCLSAFQMLEDYRKSRGNEYDPIPVVSSGIGETGSYKQIQKHYEWLNNFEKIIIIYDQDDAGKKAVDKLSEVLPKGKMFVVTLPMKDTNEMLTKGKDKQFIRCFYDAKPYSPDGIVGSSSAPAMAREEAATPRIPLPPFMHKVQKMMASGIPLGRWVNLVAASGQGKSTFVDEMVYYWIFNSPYKLGILSLEADVGQYHIKLLSRHVGRKIELIESVEEKLAFLDSPEVLEAERNLVYNEDGTDRFYILDERDGGIESVKELIMQLIIKCECKVIVIDPYSDVLSACSLEQQEEFSAWIKGLMKSHKTTFILVNHTRKSGQGEKQGSQGANLSEESIMGSSTIFKSAACNLIFSRNKEAEDDFERNVTKMKMTKCRWTGNTGIAGEYYYDNTTHTLWDKDDWLIKNGGF